MRSVDLLYERSGEKGETKWGSSSSTVDWGEELEMYRVPFASVEVSGQSGKGIQAMLPDVEHRVGQACKLAGR